jgi:Spy/CpxP family protein refolding chaperone
MNKPWKLILLLVGIFVAGGATGVFLTVRFGRQWIVKRTAPEQWAPMHLRLLEERLDLTHEQVEQLKPIVRRNMEELGRMRAQSMSEGRAVMERMQREIAEKLTPEQRVKFDELNREMRERFRKFMPRRPGGPGGGRGGEPALPEGKPPEA